MSIQIENYCLESSKKELSICHITDIHYSARYPKSLFKQFIKEIQKSKVDYICITGDLIDDALAYQKVDMKSFYDFFHTISLYAPVICIIGNHDQTVHSLFKVKYQDAKYLEFTLKRFSRVHVLHNDVYEDEKALFIGYVGDPSLLRKELKKEDQIIEEMKNLCKVPPSKKTVILLSHSPITIGQNAVQDKLPFLQNVDFILSGHTHNGLYPFSKEGNGGIISPNKKIFPKNVRGVLPTRVPVIISGGMVKLSRVSGIFRYFNRFFRSSLTFIKIMKKR